MTLNDRIKSALKKSGKSQRAVERDAGLANGHLSVILGRGGLTVETAKKLSEALGVSPAWLLTGEGEAEPPAAKALPPRSLSPISLESSLDRAFDATRHKVSDALAVRNLLASGLTLASPTDADQLARALLDAAAWLRGKGAQVSRDALLEALALRIVELEARAAG